MTVFLEAPSHLYFVEAKGILGVSQEKVASVGVVIMFQPLPKHQMPASEGAPSSDSPSRSMVLQESEKGNQNLSIVKASREPRFQACCFLSSLISHQIFPCIMHFFGDN